MLKCDLRALLNDNKVSKYSLVVACAKRARDNAAEFLKSNQQKNREYRLAEMKLKRALNRIRVAGKD